jgi:hypothetical protein
VAYAYAGAPEPPDLLIVEMDSVRDPRAVAHPANLLKVIDRSARELFLAIGNFVTGLPKVSVHSTVVTRSK